MKLRVATASLVVAAVCPLAFADFQYQQTTKITGGAMLNMLKMMSRFSKDMRRGLEPITSNVAVKGNRMVSVDNNRTEIIDLDKETFTYIDHAKKEYSVATFQQVREAMEQAAREAEKNMADAKQKQSPEAQNVDMSFSASVRDGNKTRQIEGLDTKLAILTLAMNMKDKQTQQSGAMAVTSDMWLAPEIPGYKEVRDFHMRLAEKLGFAAGGAMNSMAMAMQRSMMKGMSDLQKEASKLNGMPVYQVTRMGMTADGKPLPAASEAPLPPTPEVQMPSAGEIASKSASNAAENTVAGQLGRLGGIGGGLGRGLGGFGRKKKQDDEQAQQQAQQQQQQAAQQQQQGPAVLMEMESSLSGFSSGAVDPAQFNVPAGYKQVAPDVERRGRK